MSAGHKKKRNLMKAFRKRLFCHRNIIVISDHKTGHIPVSVRNQCMLIVGVLGFVAWGSYSTGSYMAAQSVLVEKERKIASTSLENRRIESEFALIKRDLINMLDQDEGDMSEYAKFVIEQYKGTEGGEGTQSDAQLELANLDSLDHNVVLERIAFLESKLNEMKANHASVIDSIRFTTQGKIEELEAIIATTGLNPQTLAGKLDKENNKLAARKQPADRNAPQGGPFNPVDEERLIEEDAKLHEDLQQMMTLHEIVDKLPLAHPMKNTKITSGYGMRIDPFRHRLARHTGIDFVAGHGAPIYSTNNGVVTETGRRGAYGIAVEIDHGLGVSTLYGHMSRTAVSEGQKIKKGQIIGYQGNTGRSTGSHLHYEVRYHGSPVNPKNFIEAGKHVRKIENH